MFVHENSCCAATTINIYIFWHWFAWIYFLTVWFFRKFPLAPFFTVARHDRMCKQKKTRFGFSLFKFINYLILFPSQEKKRNNQNGQLIEKNFGGTYIAFYFDWNSSNNYTLAVVVGGDVVVVGLCALFYLFSPSLKSWICFVWSVKKKRDKFTNFRISVWKNEGITNSTFLT